LDALAQFELWTISAATKERAMVGNQQKSRWSANVTAHSDALELEPKVFEKESAGEIAAWLKRSAESSDRRKTKRLPISHVDVDLRQFH
jgi:hypothetical protein